MTCLCGDSNVHPWYLERLVYTIVEAIWLIREHWKQNQNCEAIEVFVSESEAANSAEELPERLKTWAFGECVRMLHVGPDPLNKQIKYEDAFKRTDSNTTSQQKMHFSKNAFRIPSLIYGTPSTRQRQDIRPRSVFPAIIAGLVESQLATTGRVRYTDPIALQRHG